MPEQFRSGQAGIELDQDLLIRQLDLVTDGAASSFVQRATQEIRGIETGAVSRWPQRTGRTAGGFSVTRSLTATAITVQLGNEQRYTWWTRWSVRTEDSLDAEADRMASRGRDPSSQQTIRDFWRRRLTRAHGLGSPTAALAGKRPWSVLVQSPARKALRTLVPQLRGDLERLAKDT